MYRLLLLCSLLFGAFALPTTVDAQGSTKAYAPENLSQLSYSERVRVLENEYYDQSGGRSLPDDQLEFYLDSIESGWSFSRIKQDMATSLGGNYNGDWNPGGDWSPRNVICSSVKNRYTECRTPFNGRALVTQQISKTRCQEGVNWGQRQGMIWVNKGCRARFSETSGGGGWGNGNNADTSNRVTCESTSNKFRECPTYFRGRPLLYRKFSKESCDEGPDWGYRTGSVWVRNGCRAEFYDSYGNGNGNDWNNGNGWGNNNYSVTCSSEGGNYKTCAWDHRYGSPRLIQQLSKQSCVSGRTWGYDNRGLWVSDGCRARFGSR
jgi:hypothetical protein